MSTENLSTEERRNLADGAVIEWQRPDGGWQRGTVDYIDSADRVRLYDGGIIGPKAAMRLVSASPAIPTDCDVRGMNNDGVRFAKATTAKPSDLELDEAADAEEPEAQKAAEPVKAPPPEVTPKRSRRGDNKRQDAALWLMVVRMVQDRMYAGMDRTSAVRDVAGHSAFTSIRLNVATFCWWRARFVKDGQMDKPRKTMPKLATSPKAVFDSEQTRILVMTLNQTSEELQAVKDHCDGIIRERDAAINGQRLSRGAAKRIARKAVELRAELANRVAALDATVAQLLQARNERDELRKEVAEQSEALRQGRATIERLRGDLATHADALRTKESEVSALAKALEAAEADRASLALATQELQRSLAACHERITEQRDQLASERAARALLHRELGAAKARPESPSARVSVTIEATPADAAAILTAIGGR